MNNDIESQLGLRLWIIFCWIGIADPRPKMLAHNFTNEPFLTTHLIRLIRKGRYHLRPIKKCDPLSLNKWSTCKLLGHGSKVFACSLCLCFPSVVMIFWCSFANKPDYKTYGTYNGNIYGCFTDMQLALYVINNYSYEKAKSGKNIFWMYEEFNSYK